MTESDNPKDPEAHAAISGAEEILHEMSSREPTVPTVAFVRPTGALREEVDEAITLLKEAGFGVLPSAPVEGLTRPEAVFCGRTYRGLDEIKQLVGKKENLT